MAYFNSIRELGHAATLIRADIREYMNAMWDRQGLTKAIGGEEALKRRRFINRDLELTSRIQSNQIPEILQQLFSSVQSGGDHSAVDICLATNMIQVGLDVPRLSLMALIGQPKTTAEYIQASSRVGRQEPGLVVTIYNPARPRDRHTMSTSGPTTRAFTDSLNPLASRRLPSQSSNARFTQSQSRSFGRLVMRLSGTGRIHPLHRTS